MKTRPLVLLTSRIREATNRPKFIFAIIFLVLGVASFAAGFYTYKFLLAPSNKPDSTDRFSLHGYAIVRAYHSDGTMYQNWEGSNYLNDQAYDAIAVCLSGNSSTPIGFGSCSGMINATMISDAPFAFSATKAAVNTLVPADCNPIALYPVCTGWKTHAVFSSEFTQTESIFRINAGMLRSVGFVPFDAISVVPVITVNPGDTLDVTITFTIS